MLDRVTSFLSARSCRLVVDTVMSLGDVFE